MKLKNIPFYFTHPDVAYKRLQIKLSDKYAIKQQWQEKMSYPLNLKQPRGFMEKLNWLKLYDHNSQYAIMADKVLAKIWVAERIGEEHIIPTIAVYDTADDIDLAKLPDKFVLKCNHDSSGAILCKDKSLFDLKTAADELNKHIGKNYYFFEYEWAYKNIKRKILAEEFIDSNLVNPQELNMGDSLMTYKFMCFNGIPKIMYITVKNDDIFEDYFDMDYIPLNIQRRYRHSGTNIPKPQTWEEMKDVARRLSEGIPFLRVDLYEIAGEVKFSECTFYDWGGYCAFDEEWEYKIGNWITLPKKKYD